MKSLRTRIVSGLFVCVVVGAGASAGDLNPPPGAVAPTMKPLSALEPRVCVNELAGSPDAMHVITEPGNYYLTGDIVVQAGKVGIGLDTPNTALGSVVIDLNGFSILGQPGSSHGIASLNLQPLGGGLTVHGRGGGGGGAGGIAGCDGDGVHVTNAARVVLDLSITQCGGDGVHVSGADRVEVRGTIEDCDGDGIDVSQCRSGTFGEKVNQGLHAAGSSRVARCGGFGVVTDDCDDIEVAAMRVSECASGGMEIGMSAAAVRASLEDCVVQQCSGAGIRVLAAGQAPVVSVSRSSALQCLGDGLHVSGASAVDVRDWRDTDSDGDGIHVLGGLLPCDVDIRDSSSTNATQNGVKSEGVSVKFIRVELARSTGAGQSGMDLEGETIELSRCTTSGNAQRGVITRGRKSTTLVEHTSDDNGWQGTFLAPALGQVQEKANKTKCAARGNGFGLPGGGAGVHVEGTTSIVLREVDSSGNAGSGLDLSGDTIEAHQCTTNGNSQRGVFARGKKGTTLTEHESNDNDWEGSFLAPALGQVQEKAKQSKCSARGNGFGLPGGGAGVHVEGTSSVILHEVDSSGNAGSGVLLRDFDRDGRLDLVTCSGNGLHGVHTQSALGLPVGRVHVTGLLTDGNSMDGIYLEGSTGGVVMDSTASGNGGAGLRIIGTDHVVTGVSCITNFGGPMFVTAPGNVVGPLIDELSIAGNCNPGANYVR